MIEDIQTVLITEKEIKKRVKELGKQISKDYKGKDLVLISVLKGGSVFLADLMRAITIPVTIDFMAILSYGPSTESLGVVKIVKDLEESISEKDVIVVEDIVDTGLTLNYLTRNLKSREPASLEICSLLDKSVRRIANIPIKYKGFEVPDVYLVGYGLDYVQVYRNLPFIGELKPSIYAE
ncbi:MAG: hypoxanthine phosphoribosyltransferase [Candidatus Subteraquimicrobiales bacterium]|nr:hypoxanthine phosphoribosyltransferase [Candidatus Subteraquimicrobiales bacterium]